MLKNYMHRRERYYAMLNDNRVVQPFGWGAEFVSDHVNGDDPRKILADHSRQVIENSDEYFAAPDEIDFSLEKRLYPSAASMNAAELKGPVVQTEIPVLTWKSAVETPSVENNTAIATYFRTTINVRRLSSCRIGMPGPGRILTLRNISTLSACRHCG